MMKYRIIIFCLVFALLASSGIIGQNRLSVNAFASSALSENAFSFFMDHHHNSGSQLAVQVRESNTAGFVGGCTVSATAYLACNPQLIINIPSTSFQEVRPGLYVMRGSGDLFNAVFNKAGLVTMSITAAKPGFQPGGTMYEFRNASYLEDYHAPDSEIWFGTPAIFTTDAADRSNICATIKGNYYPVWVSTLYDGNPVELIVPVHEKDHIVPKDWIFYSETARTLAVAHQRELFRSSIAMQMKEDVEKLRKQLKIAYTSGKSIEYLVPLLNTLAKGAMSGGATVYFDVKRMVAMETAQFFLSASANPKSYAEGYFYHHTMERMQQVVDSLNYIIPLLQHLEATQSTLSLLQAEVIYRKWKFVLTTTAISIDMAEHQFIGKGVGKKLLEEQIEYMIGSQLHETVKLVQFARYLQNSQRSMLMSMKHSEEIQKGLYTAFERHWVEEGAAKVVFEKLAGKSLIMSTAPVVSEVSRFSCTHAGNYNLLTWEITPDHEKTGNFVIKYDHKPITEQSWRDAYYVMLPGTIEAPAGVYQQYLYNFPERQKGVYFGIRYIDQEYRTSHLVTAVCMQPEVNKIPNETSGEETIIPPKPVDSDTDKPEKQNQSSAFFKKRQEEAINPSDQQPATENQAYKTQNKPQVHPVNPDGIVKPSSDTGKSPFSGDMIFVKGGCFIMGTNDMNYQDATPAHKVCVDDFYISKAPVTQKQWKNIIGTNPSSFKGCDDCPVENISWNDVQLFIQQLNQITGKKYRLPTEAEWEYAARGGTATSAGSVTGSVSTGSATATKYAGSNNIDEVAWYESNSGSRTQPVGNKKPNELGIYDMSGNVFEWCKDLYSSDYYKFSPKQNPQGPSSGTLRVIRGGAWSSGIHQLTIFYRAGAPHTFKTQSVGFRLASD